MSFITNIGARVLDGFHEYADPEYVQKKDEAREKIQEMKLMSLAGIVTSVVLAILGITIAAAGSAVAALPIISASLLLGYTFYNINKTFTNMEEVNDNPKQFQNYVGFGGINEKKMKSQLSKGTFCFEWFINHLVKQMTEKKSAS